MYRKSQRNIVELILLQTSNIKNQSNLFQKEQRENEEKRRLKEEFDIASGLLRTRLIL